MYNLYHAFWLQYAFGGFVESAMKVGLPGPFLRQTEEKKK